MEIKHQFLELLRAGLWGDIPAAELFGEGADWNSILNLAKKQTVLGIVYDGIEKLPRELQPPKSMLLTLYFNVVKIEQTHAQINAVLEEVYNLYSSLGVTSILLKGQGIASCYANPNHRQCGDIDLYIGKKAYKKVNQAARDYGMAEESELENVKHRHFTYKGIDVENHKRINILYRPFANRRLQRYFAENLYVDSRVVPFGTAAVHLANPEVDAIILLVHTANHFLEGGVGIRQLCDFAVLLNRYGEKFDKERFGKVLKHLKLERTWYIFSFLVVKYLGLAKEKVPLYSDAYEINAEIVMQTVLREGNFGFDKPGTDARPKGYFAGKWYSFKQQLDRRKKIFSTMPVEAFYFSFWHLYLAFAAIFYDIVCRTKR